MAYFYDSYENHIHVKMNVKITIILLEFESEANEGKRYKILSTKLLLKVKVQPMHCIANLSNLEFCQRYKTR